jgi:hypothetical protein
MERFHTLVICSILYILVTSANCTSSSSSSSKQAQALALKDDYKVEGISLLTGSDSALIHLCRKSGVFIDPKKIFQERKDCMKPLLTPTTNSRTGRHNKLQRTLKLISMSRLKGDDSKKDDRAEIKTNLASICADGPSILNCIKSGNQTQHLIKHCSNNPDYDRKTHDLMQRFVQAACKDNGIYIYDFLVNGGIPCLTNNVQTWLKMRDCWDPIDNPIHDEESTNVHNLEKYTNIAIKCAMEVSKTCPHEASRPLQHIITEVKSSWYDSFHPSHRARYEINGSDRVFHNNIFLTAAVMLLISFVW